MTSTSSTIIVILALTTVALVYLYYQSRQSVVEIKLSSVRIDRQ